VRPEPPRCANTRAGVRCALSEGHPGRCAYSPRARMNVRRMAAALDELEPDAAERLVAEPNVEDRDDDED